MKGFHYFFGMFFLVLIAVSQSVAADNIIPSGLEKAIEDVKRMELAGASKKDIAIFVKDTVKNRLEFINHGRKIASSLWGDPELEIKVNRYNSFIEKSHFNSENFDTATWAWENKIGQCNESAAVAFHILAMAYESTDMIRTVNVGGYPSNHRFVIFGDDVRSVPDSYSPDDLRKLDNVWFIDAWDDKSYSTKDLGDSGYQSGDGQIPTAKKYTRYKQLYDRWLTWCKEHPDKYQNWLNAIPETSAQKAKDKKERDRLLAQYRKEIDELQTERKKLNKQFLDTGEENYNEAFNDLQVAMKKRAVVQHWENGIFDYVYEGKVLCDDSMKLHQKILSLSAALEEGEDLINAKIDLAKSRAENCTTDADGAFIRGNYQAAQDAYSIMINAKDGALVAYEDRKIKLNQIETINDRMKAAHSSGDWKRFNDDIRKLIKNNEHLEPLKTGLKDTKGYTAKVQVLKQKIEVSQQNYAPYFEGSVNPFAKHVQEVTNDTKLDYAGNISGMELLVSRFQEKQTALDNPIGDPLLFSGAPPLIQCKPLKASKELLDKIDESFLRGLFVLKTSDYLRDGCQTNAVPSNDNDNEDVSEECAGGLKIIGPTEIGISESVSYFARDTSGVLYDPGIVSWSYTNETLASFGSSGNPLTGVGFKAGTFMIRAQCDSYIAWLDVEVIPADETRISQQLNRIQKDLNAANLLSQKAQMSCAEIGQTVSGLSVSMQQGGKSLQLLEDKTKAIFERTQKFQKSKTAIINSQKKVEKTATQVTEITDDIGKNSLELCQRTKALNDYTISNVDHDANYAWIQAKQATLKELLDSAKNNTDQIEGLFNNIKKPQDYTDLFSVKTKTELDQNIRDTNSSSLENKKTMGKAASSLMAGKNSLENAKTLKDTSIKELKGLENNLDQLLTTDSGKKIKDRIDNLNQIAETIDVSQCPEKLTQALANVSKTFDARQMRIRKLTDLYANVQSGFDENIKAAENLDQVYEKIAYLADLAKADMERATDAETKGEFCSELAGNIMKNVFIPDVRGFDIGKAEQKLTGIGLTVTRSELGSPPSEAKTGIVESQTPRITKRVKKGTLVTLSHYDMRLSRSSQLANTDCSQYFGSQPAWDTEADRPACGCPGEMLWNQDRTMCISQIDAALENANCQYPNSYPVWNKNLERVECGCLPGTAWNRDNSACIDSKQAVLEGMDCSQYPEMVPGYDPSGNPMCVCPGGLPWIGDLNRCANQQDVAMASMDCSQYPGAIPSYDPNGNLGCACPDGLSWNQDLNRCAGHQDVAMASIDCSHLPGSAPTWSIIYNRFECECQEPYTSDPMTGKCVDFAAQILQRERDSIREREQAQRDFEERMANKRKQDQKQLEELWYNSQPVVVQPKPSRPSTPSKDTGNTYQTQQNNCGRKIPKQELASLKENYRRMVKQWSHVQGWYENFRLSVGADRYLNRDRYQKNVEIWDAKTKCWNGCAMNAPKSGAKSADIKRFYNCRQKCFKDFKYDNTCE